MISTINSGINAAWQNFGIQKPPPQTQGNFPMSVGAGSGMSNIVLDGDALISAGFRLPGGGWMSASVFKADSFSEESPIMLVRGIDVCGTKFEKEVNINDVNPHNASIVEMLALDGYFKANGQPASTTRAFVNAMATKDAAGEFSGSINAFSTFNFVEILQNHMKLFIANQCQNGVAWLNPILDTLINHIERT